MNKLFLITAVLVLAASWTMAQSSTSQQPDTSQPAKPDTAQTEQSDPNHVVEGCLTRQANKLIVTDAQGYTYELFGETKEVKENIGHQVRLYGDLGSSGGGPRIQAQGPQRLFGVKRVETLSDTCK
jgi:hypothetical protein